MLDALCCSADRGWALGIQSCSVDENSAYDSAWYRGQPGWRPCALISFRMLDKLDPTLGSVSSSVAWG